MGWYIAHSKSNLKTKEKYYWKYYAEKLYLKYAIIQIFWLILQGTWPILFNKSINFCGY